MIADEYRKLAAGCEDCRYGILLSPEPAKHLPLIEGRRAMLNDTTFCTCWAGEMYERALRRAEGPRDNQSVGTVGYVPRATTVSGNGQAGKPGKSRSIDSFIERQGNTWAATQAGWSEGGE